VNDSMIVIVDGFIEALIVVAVIVIAYVRTHR
jgi:hypothetical protein